MNDKQPRTPSEQPSAGGKGEHDHMADPAIHDGAAQQPGAPEPPKDRRQGHRQQKDSL